MSTSIAPSATTDGTGVGRRERREAQERADILRTQQERLEIMDVIVEALDRRQEVMELIDGSSDRYEAVAVVADLLGLSDPALARVVLDLQLGHFTRDGRTKMTHERDELRRHLQGLGAATE